MNDDAPILVCKAAKPAKLFAWIGAAFLSGLAIWILYGTWKGGPDAPGPIFGTIVGFGIICLSAGVILSLYRNQVIFGNEYITVVRWYRQTELFSYSELAYVRGGAIRDNAALEFEMQNGDKFTLPSSMIWSAETLAYQHPEIMEIIRKRNPDVNIMALK